MKPVILLWLLSFASVGLSAPQYRHKSEAAIARMTPAQRVDEWANEQIHHQPSLSDHFDFVIEKYVLRDGLAGLPRMIEIVNDYDPTRAPGRRAHKGERFDAMLMLLEDLDNHVARLRGVKEGRRAVEALEQAISRMRIAGYSQRDRVKWSKYERLDFSAKNLEFIEGVSGVDDSVKDTLWVRYKILLSKEELLAFSNFLVAFDATYPAWSETDFMEDYTRLSEAGYSLLVHIMKKPERFYEAYLEFKETKQ